MLNNYALIIGVEDYSAHDRAMNLPAGTSRVAGAVNDAKALFRQCLAMGYSPERIHVLTTPRLAPRELGPEAYAANVGEATHEGIAAGVAWLAEALARPERASGLLTFTGHAVAAGGVLLAPSDTTGAFDQAVDVAAVRRHVGKGKVRDNLTILLDGARGHGTACGLAARLAEKAGCRFRQRVVSAAPGSGTTSFGGAKVGAFTWAVASAMGNARTRVDHGVASLEITYGALATQSGQLAGTLGLGDPPALSGTAGVAEMLFLSVTPDQLDGGENLAFRYYGADGNWHVFANVQVISGTEYWSVATDLLLNLGSASQLQLTPWQQLSSSNAVSENASASARWAEETDPTYNAGSAYVTFTPSSANYYSALGVEKKLAVTFQLQEYGSGYDLAHIYWYNPFDANITNANNPNGTVSWGGPDTTSSYPGTCYYAPSNLQLS